MAHNHNHAHTVQGKNLLFSILLNVGITAAQVAGGLISGSLALLSDALHNFSDVLSLIISYVANKLSHKAANNQQTFGLKRAELIAAFVNSLSLVLVALILIYEAVSRYFEPVAIIPDIVIWMAVVGIVANGLSVLLLQKDSQHNLNMKSAYLHLLTDMMASIAVLIGGLMMKYFQVYWIDSVMTVLIAIYLMVMGIDLLKKATKMLMLFTPEHLNIEAIIKEVHAISGVKNMHHIHLWHLNEEELHFEAHVDCSTNITISQFNVLSHKIEETLHDKFGITHVTIHPEYGKDDAKDYIIKE
jgi:cobalt-zinc-cadmium efflux system protein